MSRFSDTRSKVLSFTNNKVITGGALEPIPVIFRGSSSKGLERFIEQDPRAVGDRKLVVFGAPGIEKNGLEECIALHQEYLLDHKAKLVGGYLLRSALDIMKDMEGRDKEPAEGKLKPVDDLCWFKDDLIQVRDNEAS